MGKDEAVQRPCRARRAVHMRIGRWLYTILATARADAPRLRIRLSKRALHAAISLLAMFHEVPALGLFVVKSELHALGRVSFPTGQPGHIARPPSWAGWKDGRLGGWGGGTISHRHRFIAVIRASICHGPGPELRRS